MARRTRRVGFLEYGPTLTSGLLVCVAAGVALLGYMRLKEEQHRLDAQIGLLEQQIRDVRTTNQRLQTDYETLVSSTELAGRLRRMKLELRMPAEGERVVLPEPLEPPHPPAGWVQRSPSGRRGMLATGGGWEHEVRR